MLVKHFIVQTLFIVSTICLFGCASSQQVVIFPDQSKLVEDQTKARIYVLGNPALNLRLVGNRLVIVADQEWIGDIVKTSYLCWEREPGIARIRTRIFEGGDIKFTVEKGKTYYIRADTFVASEGGGISSKLEQVEEAEGKKILLNAKPPERIK
jgi:hypothetical protein